MFDTFAGQLAGWSLHRGIVTLPPVRRVPTPEAAVGIEKAALGKLCLRALLGIVARPSP